MEQFIKPFKSNLVITVDGYSSCGKSTFAKQIAKELGYIYVDSGAMYRAAALFFSRHNGFQGDEVITEKVDLLLPLIVIDFRYNPTTGLAETILNDVNVEKEIRTLEMSGKASTISKIKSVRQKMVDLQRRMGSNKRIVMDGRDIGSVVFPDAELKIFMTATIEVRAQRRLKELLEKGERITFEQVAKNLEERDFNDTHRAESPLIKPHDAVVLDNSNMTPDEQMDWFRKIIQEIIK